MTVRVDTACRNGFWKSCCRSCQSLSWWLHWQPRQVTAVSWLMGRYV